MADKIPDFSRTYFPPPPGSSTLSSSTQRRWASSPLPPPPPRQFDALDAGRTPVPPTYSHSALLRQHSPSLNISRQNSSQNIAQQTPRTTPYQPHANLRSQHREQTHEPVSERGVLSAPPFQEQAVTAFSSQASAEPSSSHQLPSPQPCLRCSAFRTPFASISIHHSDHIRFLHFPATIHGLIRATISSAWPRGIQSERFMASQCLAIKLKGNPWGIASGEIKVVRSALGEDVRAQAIQAQRLMCALLEALHGEGWVLMMRTDLSNMPWDADTMLFRHQNPAPAPCTWFSLDFSSQNKLRFVDASPEVCVSVVTRFISNKLEFRHKEHKVEGCYEIKLVGTIAMTVYNENMNTRIMFLELLHALEGNGWTVYASVNQSAKSDKQGMTDTWYCCKPVSWVQGAPVYHH